MIHLDNLALEGFFPVDLALAAGESAVVVAESARAAEGVVRTLVGLAPPAAGTPLLLGEEVAALAPRDAMQLLGRVGVVWRDGGLITNLGLGANALLPATYHGRPQRVVEEEGLHLLRTLGLSTDPVSLGRLPADVAPWQCRLVGMVRAWLTQPEVVLYDGLLEELPRGLAPRVARLATDLARDSGSATLHLTTDATTADLLGVERVVCLQREGNRPPVEDARGGRA